VDARLALRLGLFVDVTLLLLLFDWESERFVEGIGFVEERLKRRIVRVFGREDVLEAGGRAVDEVALP
jgi:hypothetical protein